MVLSLWRRRKGFPQSDLAKSGSHIGGTAQVSSWGGGGDTVLTNLLTLLMLIDSLFWPKPGSRQKLQITSRFFEKKNLNQSRIPIIGLEDVDERKK